MGKTLIESILGDTGDLAEWSEDKLDPADLTKLSKEPASVLWTVRFVHRVHIGCWVARWVRGFRLWLAVGIGVAVAILALNTVGFFALRAAMRESQRATVIQTLKELRIISTESSPAAEDSVATLDPGGSP